MTEVRDRDASRLEVRTRIVDAAARLLREGGVDAVTTRGVAEAAGVQAPTLYRLLGDKDGLLDAVAERELARYVTAKSGADEGDPVDDLRAAWSRHIAFGLANPALSTLLADPTRGAQSPAAAAGLEVLRARVHRIAAAGRLAVPERRAVEMIHAAGTGAVLALLAVPVDRRDPALADAMLDAVLAAVLADAPTRSRGDDASAAAAVTLRAAAPELTALSPGERGLLAEWLERLAAAP